jgi:2'-5' RNA ligase
LPCPQILIQADEHGNVSGYIQRTDTDRRAVFEPHQVIHIKMDSPRGGLYGLGPTEGAVHSITTWLFTEGLLKATMKRGNPPNIGIAWDPDLGIGEVKRFSQQYASRNLGPDNVGNPVEVKGKTEIHEFAQNKIAEYMAVKNGCRDEMCGEYGVPPAIVAIIESGNLGGGTGTSQFKNFRVNTCGPLEELVLEAFTFAILEQGFGVEDHRCTFDEIDWRDDEVIEKIRTMRVERAGWSVNRYKDDIGEPPVDGGDASVIILSRDVVPVQDIEAHSAAAASKGGLPAEIGADSGPPPRPATSTAPVPTPAGTPSDAALPKHAKGAPNESAMFAEQHTGAMVALFVPATLAAELALDGGEPPGEMHVTLAYLGDAADLDGDPEDLAQVIAAWALETPPLAATFGGLGLFTPHGDDPPVTYASVDSPDLPGARHRLVEALKRSGFPANMDHGFTPHVTLAFANVIDQANVPDTVFRFGAVTLAVGGERQSWALTGTPVEASSERTIFEADLNRRRARAIRELQEA